jgi:hypothetical protein
MVRNIFYVKISVAVAELFDGGKNLKGEKPLLLSCFDQDVFIMHIRSYSAVVFQFNSSTVIQDIRRRRHFLVLRFLFPILRGMYRAKLEFCVNQIR